MKQSFTKMLSAAFTVIIVCFSFFSGMESSVMPENSLFGPFDAANENLLFWDISGSTEFANTYVRLTTDEQQKQGSIWNTFPCYYNNWEFQAHFHIHGKGINLNGDGMALWFVKNPLHAGPVFGAQDYFTGLGVFIDTFENQREPHYHPYPYVSAMVNNGSLHYANEEDGTMTEIGGCYANVRNLEIPTRIAVSYINNNLAVYLNIHETGNWILCFTTLGVYLPTGYFLGVSASTSDVSDNHDIISLTTLKMDPDGKELEDKSHVVPFVQNVHIPQKYHKEFVEREQKYEEIKRDVEEEIFAWVDDHDGNVIADKGVQDKTKTANKDDHDKTDTADKGVHDKAKTADKDDHDKTQTADKSIHDEAKAADKGVHDEAKAADKGVHDEAKAADKDEEDSISQHSSSWFKMFIYITGLGILTVTALSIYRNYNERKRIRRQKLF